MKYTKENLEPIVLKSCSISEILRNLNLNESGGNHTTIKKNINKYNIDTSHFLGSGWRKGNISYTEKAKKHFINNVLILNGLEWGSHNIKLGLFKFELKERKCEKCNQNEIWFENFLSLHLEHKNGNHKDNRLENLEILCPNCHSQTATYCGKKNKKEKKDVNNRKYDESKQNKCICGKLIKNKSKHCLDCHHKQLRKVERPSIEQLQNEINKLGYSATGRKYNVSDNTIRKWIKADVVELA